MIQDIAPHVYDNSFQHRREPRDDDFVFITRNGKEMLLKQEGEAFRFPTVAECGRGGLRFAFLVDDRAFFLGTDAPEKEGFAFEKEARFRTLRPQWLAFAGITGMQLSRWYAGRKFCGRCGREMRDSLDERARVCDACGMIEYPKLSPAVIVAIVHDGKLLVTKYADRPLTSLALVAGYTEIGETVEETIRREVMEEVGLRVKDLTFYKSQPWSFSDSLLMGFFCRLDGEDETVALDEHELKEAHWLRPEDLPCRAGEPSMTAEMMEQFRLGRAEELLKKTERD